MLRQQLLAVLLTRLLAFPRFQCTTPSTRLARQLLASPDRAPPRRRPICACCQSVDVMNWEVGLMEPVACTMHVRYIITPPHAPIRVKLQQCPPNASSHRLVDNAACLDPSGSYRRVVTCQNMSHGVRHGWMNGEMRW